MALPVDCEFRCPVRECHVIDYVADADRDKGDIVEVEDGIGMVTEDVLDTEDGAVAVKVPKLEGPKAAVTIAAGETAYVIDGTPGSFTNVAGANRKCGHFNEAAALSATTCELYFDGFGS